MSKTIAQPKQFIYLDEQGINSLYSQCVTALETEASVSMQNTVGATASAKITLKSLFAPLLGVGGEATVQAQGTQLKGTEVKTKLSTEQILSKLIESLSGQEGVGVSASIGDAAERITGTVSEAYLSTVEAFDVPQMYSSADASLIAESGVIMFERNISAISYNQDDDYFKKMHKTVMAASLTKFLRSQGVFNQTSHEAIYFRAFQGRAIPLGVFGTIRQLPGIYQIKPFALWMP